MFLSYIKKKNQETKIQHTVQIPTLFPRVSISRPKFPDSHPISLSTSRPIPVPYSYLMFPISFLNPPPPPPKPCMPSLPSGSSSAPLNQILPMQFRCVNNCQNSLVIYRGWRSYYGNGGEREKAAPSHIHIYDCKMTNQTETRRKKYRKRWGS